MSGGHKGRGIFREGSSRQRPQGPRRDGGQGRPAPGGGLPALMLGVLTRNDLSARLPAALCALLAAVIATSSLAAFPAQVAAPAGYSTVIVRGEAGVLAQLEHSTVLAGGTLVRGRRLIDACAARAPTAQLGAIQALRGVVAVSPDSAASFHSDYNPAGDP